LQLYGVMAHTNGNIAFLVLWAKRSNRLIASFYIHRAPLALTSQKLLIYVLELCIDVQCNVIMNKKKKIIDSF